ncbi:virulence factor Mce family protein [Mycolicibacterium aurum]|uniref:Virulence factor Mce family protein n=1 Tax=Mycolicibacterium aurum TaxID=1791 RepID=A0A3S4RS70_MYCAU|nr:MlaD family protein [Mycolicibacterium aurum]VEG51029.1 virulence factor Mce family protein [Mycolicibacterium aurum]
MLTRFIKFQLILFTILTIVALSVLGLYYLRLPSLAGVGQYSLYAELPRSGGLYETANVTYRGSQIGKVTAVEPTETGARATMSIDNKYKIPVDASANVHSVSAIGEQYLDLVSTSETTQYLSPGQTITDSTVPAEVGPALDAANNGLAALPREKIDSLLTETSLAVGGLGPSLQRLVESTTNLAEGFRDNLPQVNDIITNAAPILDSQVQSGDAIQQWSNNLNVIASQTAEQDAALRSGIEQAAPTLDQVNTVFTGVQDSLPQTLANLSVVIDMLKRYNKGLEQALVILPQGGSALQMGSIFEDGGLLHFGLSINQPPPCLTGFLPASEWRSPADTSTAPLPSGTYCKIPKDYQGNAVRGARNYPCADVPGKRAATPKECRSDQPYVPLGTNPWYGDPNQILPCPAPGARCDQRVAPGTVVPAPSVNNGMNPLPADQLPTPQSQAPISDPLSPPGSGTVSCSGQQPNPCIYTPAQGAPGSTAGYSPSSGEVIGPDGVRYNVGNSNNAGDDGWKEMLAPAG